MESRRRKGNALVIVLVLLTMAGSYFVVGGLRERLQRDQGTQAALAQARQALVGFAATYRDRNAGEVFGYLPCPDTDNDGIADAPCGAAGVSAIGRLPWKTLGLPPLRDGAGECLWYAIAGRAKDSPRTIPLNWDTPGLFILRDPAGNALTGASPHDFPLAVVIAPGGAIGTQVRASAGTGECGGSNVISAYLDGADPIYGGPPPAAGATSVLTLSTDDSRGNRTNNDQAQWITADDLFQRVRARSDFAGDVNTLLDRLKYCLDTAASLPAALGSKGFMGSGGSGAYPHVTNNCAPYTSQTPERKVLDQWSNNLLYAKGPSLSLNGQPCSAILFFGGARSSGQLRTTTAQIDAPANYLEGTNATAFPGPGAYTAGFPSAFAAASPQADLARCITGIPAGSVSFAANFASFTPAGNGVTVNAADKTVAIASTGVNGGCFWYPDAVPLAGKTFRAYYRYTFSLADSHALTGSGTDRGNGFTFEMLSTDFPGRSPTTPPACGRAVDMGAIVLGTPSTINTLSQASFIIETDIRQDAGDMDPGANHTAIMANGNLDHSPTNGNATPACNATVQGCVHAPANKFEESPTPAPHNQRIEIATGCNGTCSSCNPAGHGAPNNHARIRVWVDCTACTDTTVDFPAPPTMQRCTALPAGLSATYLGFTGGFRSGTASQGVTIQDFILLSQ